MLTQNQKMFLSTIPAEKIVHIKPFDPRTKEVASQIMGQIEQKLPNAKIHFIGASALGIAGQNDIDLPVISSGSFDEDKDTLIELFGEPAKDGFQRRYASWEFKWEFKGSKFPVELSLNDDMSPQIKEQIDIFNLLQEDKKLRGEYEQLKLAMDGKTYKEYQTVKYEFYNRILGLRLK